jgi:hypothetical protein
MYIHHKIGKQMSEEADTKSQAGKNAPIDVQENTKK